LHIDAALLPSRNGESCPFSADFRCFSGCSVVLYFAGLLARDLIPFLLTVPRPTEPGLCCADLLLSVEGDGAVAVPQPRPLGGRLECAGLVRDRGSVVEEDREPLMDDVEGTRNESDEL